MVRERNTMQQQPTDSERITALENKLADLERRYEQRWQTQEDRDIALLARIDGFITDLRRMERAQIKATEEIKRGQTEERAIIIDALKSHKAAIDNLNAGQQQILSLLTGLSKTND